MHKTVHSLVKSLYYKQEENFQKNKMFDDIKTYRKLKPVANAVYEIKEGVITKHIFDGVRRIVSKKGGNIFWYHTDHLGSTGFLTTEQDVNGDVQVIQKTTYFPFGETKEVPPVEEVQYKFTGQEYDPETGPVSYTHLTLPTN